jgi:hypothetical protein
VDIIIVGDCSKIKMGFAGRLRFFQGSVVRTSGLEIPRGAAEERSVERQRTGRISRETVRPG